MYYHASKVPEIKILFPHISNHGKSLVYFSEKKENTLVYLSNAIEKYCVESRFLYEGIWKKWASYGFEKNGVLRLDEYYPNATEDTYKGVAGYIYGVNNILNMTVQTDIPGAIVTSDEVKVDYCEYIPDAYEAIMCAVDAGVIQLKKYEENSQRMLNWIESIISNEYESAKEHPEYKYFLEAKFDFIKNK